MIYLDSNVFIYAVLDKGKKGEYCKKLLEAVALKQINAFTSVLTWDEVVFSLRKHVPVEEVVKQSNKFLKFPNLFFLEVNIDIIEKAEQIWINYKLKPRDAIHVATAMISNIKKIASDDSYFDKIKDVKRVFLK